MAEIKFQSELHAAREAYAGALRRLNAVLNEAAPPPGAMQRAIEDERVARARMDALAGVALGSVRADPSKPQQETPYTLGRRRGR